MIQYCTIREGLYRRFAQQPSQAKFLKGWLRRLNALRAEIGLPGSDVSFGDPSEKISFTPPLLTEAEWEFVARAGSTSRYEIGTPTARRAEVGPGWQLQSKPLRPL